MNIVWAGIGSYLLVGCWVALVRVRRTYYSMPEMRRSLAAAAVAWAFCTILWPFVTKVEDIQGDE